MPLRTCKLRGGAIFETRLRGGAGKLLQFLSRIVPSWIFSEDETLKRKRSKDSLIPPKRFKSTQTADANRLLLSGNEYSKKTFVRVKLFLEQINTDEEVSIKHSKGDIFKKHITTAVTEMFNVENSAIVKKGSFNLNTNEDCSENKNAIVHQYSCSGGIYYGNT